ncbi:MAG: PorT family protein [Cytophagales bacterium]|nr:PorT family protein [Cytophagales bacterium]
MSKFLYLIICLLPLSLSAQWSHQLQFGFVLGSDKSHASARVADTLIFSYSKAGLNYPSGSFMTTLPINEKWLFRTGIDGSKTTVDVRVHNTRTRNDIYYERRTVADMHIPVEVQYEASKGFYLNSGFSVNPRLEFTRAPQTGFLETNTGNDEFEDVAYNSMREVSFNYRVGTTVKFFPWLGVDLMYDRPFASLVKPLKLGGDEKEVKFKYGVWTARIVYFFEWQKLKNSLNRNEGKVKKDFW